VGEEDTTTDAGKAHRMHKAIKHSQLVVIPSAGHSSTIEQPDRVNAAISSFLGQLELKDQTSPSSNADKSPAG